MVIVIEPSVRLAPRQRLWALCWAVAELAMTSLIKEEVCETAAPRTMAVVGSDFKRQKPGFGHFGHTMLTRLPLVPEVLQDIDRCIGSFEATALRSFAAFRSVASEMRIVDLLDTAKVGGRNPRSSELPTAYAALLFEAVVRRVVDLERTFEARLGALYLLLTLHELQPGVTKAPVPVLETQWSGFERLARELRVLRHADGFRALHTLWAGGRFSHICGGQSTLVTARDQLNDREAERDAAALPAVGSAAAATGVSAGPYAVQLADGLPALAAAEAAYEAALAQAKAAVATTDMPASSAWRMRQPTSVGELSARIRTELDEYRAGAWAAAEDDETSGATITTAAAAHNAAVPSIAPTLDGEEVVAEGFLRREHVRRRAFAPRERRIRDGTSGARRRPRTTSGAAPAPS